MAISVGSLVGIALVCGFLSYFLLHKKGSIPLPSGLCFSALKNNAVKGEIGNLREGNGYGRE